MAFRLGDIAEHKDSGRIRGLQREIACDCWFTSKGKTIPRIIKVMDETGMIHTVDRIEVLFSEEKTYAGIETVEHVCRIMLAGTAEIVKIIFTKEECRWSIVRAEDMNVEFAEEVTEL